MKTLLPRKSREGHLAELKSELVALGGQAEVSQIEARFAENPSFATPWLKCALHKRRKAGTKPVAVATTTTSTAAVTVPASPAVMPARATFAASMTPTLTTLQRAMTGKEFRAVALFVFGNDIGAQIDVGSRAVADCKKIFWEHNLENCFPNEDFDSGDFRKHWRENADSLNRFDQLVRAERIRKIGVSLHVIATETAAKK